MKNFNFNLMIVKYNITYFLMKIGYKYQIDNYLFYLLFLVNKYFFTYSLLFKFYNWCFFGSVGRENFFFSD